mgnify:CR=1 FL=1
MSKHDFSSLADRVVLITGGSGHIGSTLASAFLDHGSVVVTADLVGPPDFGDTHGRHLHLAVDLAGHHLRFANGEFEALAAHCFDEDRQLQLASTLDFPGVGPLGGHDPERDVADQFGIQADIASIRDGLGWEPKVTLREGIRNMVEWAISTTKV